MRLPFALPLVLLVAACGPIPGTGVEPKLSVLQTKLFQAGGCTGCHFSASASAKLDLSKGKAHASLVGVAPAIETWKGTQWENLKLVEPGKPDESLLVIALEHPQGIPETLKMPQSTKMLVPQELRTAVRQWIADGAEDN